MTKKEIETFLTTQLKTAADYHLTSDEEKRLIHDRDQVNFIVDKLMRKKFRRYISEATRQATIEKITVSVRDHQPIQLVIPFGGYKHFWNPAYPEPDWAELFHFLWMTQYLAPIVAVYEPGVIVEYISEDLILPRMDNYPEAALESYSSAFRKLIAWYSQFIPTNLKINFWRIGDKYNQQEIIDKVLALLPERRAAFGNLSIETQEQELHRSTRSLFWHGKDDLTSLNDKQKYERLIESRLIELAYYDVEGSSEFLDGYFSKNNRISVLFSFGLSPDNAEFGDLTISSGPGSVVDFWIGRGVLKQRDDQLSATIISQQQYQDGEPNVVDINLDNDLEKISKNYEKIEIFRTSNK